MDLADDVAYSVHDVEDAIVAGQLDLRGWTTPSAARGRRRCATGTSRDADAAAIDAAPGPAARAARPGSRGTTAAAAAMAALKNLTSDLIGRFCRALPGGDPRPATAGGLRPATTPTWSCPARPSSRSRCSRASPPTT